MLPASAPTAARLPKKQVLVLVASGTCEIETVTLVTTLRQYGAWVVTASVGNTSLECSMVGGFLLRADMEIRQATDVDWDLLVIPSGNKKGCDILANSPSVNSLLARQNELKKYIAASGTAPAYLFTAIGLAPRVATCYPNEQFRAMLPSSTDHDVVIADNIITGQGGSIFVKSLAIELGKLLTSDLSSTSLSGMTLFEERRHAERSRVLRDARPRREMRYSPSPQQFRGLPENNNMQNSNGNFQIRWAHGGDLSSLRRVHECRVRYEYFDERPANEHPSQPVQQQQPHPEHADRMAISPIQTSHAVDEDISQIPAAGEQVSTPSPLQVSTPNNRGRAVFARPRNGNVFRSHEGPTNGTTGVPMAATGPSNGKGSQLNSPAAKNQSAVRYDPATNPFRHAIFSHPIVTKTVWPVFQLLGCKAVSTQGKKNSYLIPIVGSDQRRTFDSFPQVCLHFFTHPDWKDKPEVSRLMGAYQQYLVSMYEKNLEETAPEVTPALAPAAAPEKSASKKATTPSSNAIRSSEKRKIPAEVAALLNDALVTPKISKDGMFLSEKEISSVAYDSAALRSTIFEALNKLGWAEETKGTKRYFISPRKHRGKFPKIVGTRKLIEYIQSDPYWSKNHHIRVAFRDYKARIVEERDGSGGSRQRDSRPSKKRKSAIRTGTADSWGSSLVRTSESESVSSRRSAKTDERATRSASRSPKTSAGPAQSTPRSSSRARSSIDAIESPAKATRLSDEQAAKPKNTPKSKAAAKKSRTSPVKHTNKGLAFVRKEQQHFWDVLAKYGWTMIKIRHQKYYFPPGVTRENGANRKDYFDSLLLIIKFILGREEWNSKEDVMEAVAMLEASNKPKPKAKPSPAPRGKAPEKIATRRTPPPAKPARRKKPASKSFMLSSQTIGEKKALLALAQRVSSNPNLPVQVDPGCDPSVSLETNGQRDREGIDNNRSTILEADAPAAAAVDRGELTAADPSAVSTAPHVNGFQTVSLPVQDAGGVELPSAHDQDTADPKSSFGRGQDDGLPSFSSTSERERASSPIQEIPAIDIPPESIPEESEELIHQATLQEDGDMDVEPTEDKPAEDIGTESVAEAAPTQTNSRTDNLSANRMDEDLAKNKPVEDNHEEINRPGTKLSYGEGNGKTVDIPASSEPVSSLAGASTDGREAEADRDDVPLRNKHQRQHKSVTGYGDAGDHEEDEESRKSAEANVGTKTPQGIPGEAESFVDHTNAKEADVHQPERTAVIDETDEKETDGVPTSQETADDSPDNMLPQEPTADSPGKMLEVTEKPKPLEDHRSVGGAEGGNAITAIAVAAGDQDAE